MNVNWVLAVVPDNKVHGANMGPTWVLSAPDGPHVGPMNVAGVLIRRASGATHDNTAEVMTTLDLHMSLGLVSLQWRHDERHGVSYHRRPYCLLNCLFRRRSKKTPKLRVTGFCEGNSPVTGEFPAQRASNVGNVAISMTSSYFAAMCALHTPEYT